MKNLTENEIEKMLTKEQCESVDGLIIKPLERITGYTIPKEYFSPGESSTK